MYVWRHIPILRFLIPFIIGIILGNSYQPSIQLLAWVLVLFVSIIIVSQIQLKKRPNRGVLRFSSFLILSCSGILGSLFQYFSDGRSYDSHLIYSQNATNLIVQVSTQPSVKKRSVGCELRLISGLVQDSQISISGFAQAYFELDSSSRHLRYGDVLIVKNQLIEVEEALNPHQFNFKRYYRNKNIFHQGYFKKEAWKAIGENEGLWIYNFLRLELFMY